MGIKLTVFFEDPFWVGFFERFQEGHLEVAKVVFGAEPKEFEVYGLILNGFNGLRFGRSVCAEMEDERRINPKRLQRMIRKEVSGGGIGTKAQQAVKADYEAAKREKKLWSRQFKEDNDERKYELRQAKKNEKKKGH